LLYLMQNFFLSFNGTATQAKLTFYRFMSHFFN
jgi:hypothetical protein